MSKIDYQNLLDNALKSVVKEALIHAQINGLGDGAHFYITFKTRAPGVVLPDFLRIRYPDIMTIVLQYSYNNLFSALVEFKDPSVDFMLSFHPRGAAAATADNDMELPLDEKPGVVPDRGRVISLDEFRKNRKQ